MQLSALKRMMREKGCRTLYIKKLAANDNRKQQVYFGGNFTAINLIPFKKITTDPSKPHIFKASLEFYWLADDGEISHAPNSQLILYPQYPEVRFSGFLQGCDNAPSQLMDEKLRLAGRILFIGVCPDGKVMGYLCHPDSPLAHEISAIQDQLASTGVFKEIGVDELIHNREDQLLDQLKRIHSLGWIRSKRLNTKGENVACEASQCGGYTLEAELGIIPNGVAEPDYLGYEVKQYTVPNLSRITSGILTLMTPQPTGGYYKTSGVEDFIRKFGYSDMTGKEGREDRLNFGGPFRINSYHERTGLTLVLNGFDGSTGKIVDASGGITLVSKNGIEAATWHFSEIMQHWNKKHAQAVYIPSNCEKEPELSYRYGNLIRIGYGTDFNLCLKALALGKVYYDPGIKLENASTKPKVKHRSQFRIKSADVESLYHQMKSVDLSV